MGTAQRVQPRVPVIGSYLAFRGGHEYLSLIRKTEHKPLRIFLQSGENAVNVSAMLDASIYSGYGVWAEASIAAIVLLARGTPVRASGLCQMILAWYSDRRNCLARMASRRSESWPGWREAKTEG